MDLRHHRVSLIWKCGQNITGTTKGVLASRFLSGATTQRRFLQYYPDADFRTPPFFKELNSVFLGYIIGNLSCKEHSQRPHAPFEVSVDNALDNIAGALISYFCTCCNWLL